ncbi:hypothetical protein [Saccharopolyspora erythraea]|uniref:hypothetical protein n=1 Tax=Saccharopolyspora erythraea TaxID=1836 RepID=UPI0001D31452|nr:hypothetical protein [Saccharopolyspora erythraea]EQD83907.1 hypothetical protein N599_22770 [Saccharopolyspora erythraea D]
MESILADSATREGALTTAAAPRTRREHARRRPRFPVFAGLAEFIHVLFRLRFAARHRVRVATASHPFAAADRALRDLAHDRVKGAAVIRVAA